MKYSLDDYLDGECTRDEFISQYNPPKLELGKVYKQVAHSWAERHYKIIYLDDKIAVGITVYNKISNKFIGDYDLFHVNNGFKYNDIRPCYRLIEEVK